MRLFVVCDVWTSGMRALGYTGQFVSASSAHLGDQHNPPAPQWRDRLYGIFARHDVLMPTLEPRPQAWCQTCGADVEAVQWWKPRRKHAGRRIGKYGVQYVYGCPTPGHGTVEPYVLPAAAAIDFTDVGTRIGDRTRPLRAATLRRIQAGLDLYGSGAFVATLRRHAMPQPVGSRPLATFTGGGFHHCLVIPFRRGAKPYPVAAAPVSTVATHDQHGVLHPQVGGIEDAWFRMLRPREAANAQRFPAGYVIHGNRGEQQLQAGNAVSVNAAHWLGRHVLAALDGRTSA